MSSSITVIDALAPDASRSNFPLPRLNTSIGPAGSFTSEGPIINGSTVPGQWLLTGARRKYGWQVIQGNYLYGARLVPTANPVLGVKYSIKIWTSADALVYRKMLRSGILSKPIIALKTPSNGLIAGADLSSAVLSIKDPSLEDVNVTQVVVDSVTPLFNPLVASGGRGAWTAEVEFLEFPGSFRPAPPIPDQTIPDQGSVTPSAFAAASTAGALMQQGDAQRALALRRQALQQ